LISFIKRFYLHKRFFYALFGIAFLFLLSNWIHFLFAISSLLLFGFCILVFADALVLFRSSHLKAKRISADKFSNSDENEIQIHIQNTSKLALQLEIIDEIPVQFQKRDFKLSLQILPKEERIHRYHLIPKQRGEYVFGSLNVYAFTKIALVKKRYQFANEQMVKVYPSFIQMKKYDFLAQSNKLSQFGFKKIRRIGHTLEFEQIKEYVLGDDVRTINWKATAKQRMLMVNQYQDEKSQPIYNLIDKGRVMKMPFEGLSLLDYAINSTLAFSNVAIKKNDKVGMMDFSNEIGKIISAQHKKTHLNTISERLYNIETDFLVSDFSMLYTYVKRKINQRSLLMLYTNFEHIAAMRRELPYLRAIAKKHMLVVIFFENTELDKLQHIKTNELRDVYEKTIAGSFAYDKRLMVDELNRNGIQTILTKPKDLSINTINKYLEIKAKGIL
jgi:uncharacterized protein (DUF58 family)